MSTAVLRALAGKPGAAKRALYEQFGDEIAMDASEGMPPLLQQHFFGFFA